MKNLPDLSSVNGATHHFIPVSDRGLNYGDGLFETILCLDGQLILLDQHLDRLARDCQRLQMGIDQIKLKHELDLFLANIQKQDISTGVVKIIITRIFSGRGYGYVKNIGSNRLLNFYSGLSYPKENISGLRLSLCDHRLANNKFFAGIKHLNRLEQVYSFNAIKKPLYQEAIVFSEKNEVVECVSSNIFMVKEGELFTPDLSQAGVQGVMRDYILSSVSPMLKVKATIKKIYLDDLLSADEVFICNSVFGVWPVIAIHVKEFAHGKITQSIQSEINKLGYRKLYL